MAKRVDFLDIAKAYGIILVIYGHYVMYIGTSAGHIQRNLIYSFHMPLFFILSGCITKNSVVLSKEFVVNRLLTRIFPAMIFNFAGLLVTLSYHYFSKNINWSNYLYGIRDMLLGHTAYSATAWFLICLFAVEIIHSIFSRYIKTNKHLLVSIIFFLFAGWLITRKIQLFGIFQNFWYINEAFVAYGLYQIGIALKKSMLCKKERSLFFRLSLLSLAFLTVINTFNLNTFVLMIESIHGNFLLFLISAISGSLLIISLSQFTPLNKIMLFIGQNTLLYFLLDGFFRPLDIKIFKLLQNYFVLDNHYIVLAIGIVITTVFLALWTPLVILLIKYCPLCSGKIRKIKIEDL